MDDTGAHWCPWPSVTPGDHAACVCVKAVAV